MGLAFKLEIVFLQISKDFIPEKAGVISSRDGPSDPISLHVFHPPLLLGFWAAFREIVLVEGKLPRVDKEVLASFVSKANECAFCTHTHILFAEAQGNGTDVLSDAAISTASSLSIS